MSDEEEYYDDAPSFEEIVAATMAATDSVVIPDPPPPGPVTNNDDDDDDDGEDEECLLARCTYPFESTCDVELTIKIGDLVTVTRRDVGDGWWEGELNGVYGLFPEKYVKLVEVDAATPVYSKASASTEPLYAKPVAASASTAPTRPPRPASTVSTLKLSTRQQSFVIENGCKWRTSTDAPVVSIRNSRMGSKFSGIKQFTLYEISIPSSTDVVAHRFKHFAWLHDRLLQLFPCVIIPSIPDKQVQGRFDDMFVEQRRRALERFLQRASQHPVIGPSPAFKHFLVTSDYQEWKSGKRAVEQEATTSPFLSQISVPSETPADIDSLMAKISKFTAWLDKQISQLAPLIESSIDNEIASANDFKKIAVIMKRFPVPSDSTAEGRGDYAAWWKEPQGARLESLLVALGELGKTFDISNAIVSDHQESNRRLFLETFKEYQGMLKIIPSVLKTHEAAWHELHVLSQKKDAGITAEAFQSMQKKCTVVSFVVLAEFRHFHEGLVTELKAYLEKFIQEQIDYHKKMALVWQNILPTFKTT